MIVWLRDLPLALALQAYRTLPKVPAGPRSQQAWYCIEKEAVNKAELIQALSAYYDGSEERSSQGPERRGGNHHLQDCSWGEGLDHRVRRFREGASFGTDGAQPAYR